MVEEVSTDAAPHSEPLPFPQAVVHGNTVCVSAQIPPSTTSPVAGSIPTWPET